MVADSEGFAMDAFRFIMSPPVLGIGVVALAGLLAFGTGFTTSTQPSKAADANDVFVVRWTAVQGGAAVETPDGRALVMDPGENLVKLQSREECTALCRKLEKLDDVDGGSVVRVNGDTVRMEFRFPKYVDALDAKQTTRDTQDSEEVWEDYLRNFLDKVDVEWISFSKRKLELGRNLVIDSGDQNCRLCNGAGRKKCHRCQGLSATKESVKCTVCRETGFLPCEWCNV